RAHAHLIVGREASADHTARRSGHLNPIVHIVLFKDSRGTEAVLRDEAHHVLDFRRRRFIDDGPAPNLHLIRPPWMPNANGAGEPVKRKIGKNRPRGRRYLARASNPQAAFNFRGVLFHIVDQLDNGLRKPWTRIVGRTDPGHQNVTVAARNLTDPGSIFLSHWSSYRCPIHGRNHEYWRCDSRPRQSFPLPFSSWRPPPNGADRSPLCRLPSDPEEYRGTTPYRQGIPLNSATRDRRLQRLIPCSCRVARPGSAPTDRDPGCEKLRSSARWRVCHQWSRSSRDRST